MVAVIAEMESSLGPVSAEAEVERRVAPRKAAPPAAAAAFASLMARDYAGLGSRGGSALLEGEERRDSSVGGDVWAG